MERDHYKVLKTLQERCGFSKQAIKSIRGQLFAMTNAEREAYLKQIISNEGKKRRRTREMVSRRNTENIQGATRHD